MAPIAGVLLWLAVTRIPAIADASEWRLSIAAVIVAFFCLAAAREIWVRDGLSSRVPIAILLAVHTAAVLLRIPVAFFEVDTISLNFDNRWFAPMAIETLIFMQVLALLLLSLTKERAEANLRQAALTDPLTGLANRRAFFEQGARLVAQGKRSSIPTSMIAFDLDHFKQINDTYGHPFGDVILEAFAVAMRNGLRAGDLAARIGGEEFAVILPGADEQDARTVADRIVALFSDLVGATAGDRLRFTTSAGLAVSPASAQSIETIFAAADRALYDAKGRGGDVLMAARAAFA